MSRGFVRSRKFPPSNLEAFKARLAQRAEDLAYVEHLTNLMHPPLQYCQKLRDADWQMREEARSLTGLERLFVRLLGSAPTVTVEDNSLATR